MVLFELLALDIPYRLENLDHFKIFDYIESGKRPNFPPLTLELIEKNHLYKPLMQIFLECTESNIHTRLDTFQLVEKLNEIQKMIC